ncbi:MAG: phosphate butyryltransferase [Prevotellaceae bacterium]|jgi:phosphate butyryltransferase|nr:phosphate butyryltransferase [Prevotellaceae bacterium]
MNHITSFAQLRAHLKGLNKVKRIAVANAVDEHSREAVLMAVENGFAEAYFIGNKAEIKIPPSMKAFLHLIHIIDIADPKAAAEEAVRMVRAGEADVLMKGLVTTDVLLKVVLDKKKGILPEGNVLSFCAVFEVPAYHKLLFVSDPAVIPSPTLEQRTAIIKYMIEATQKFGVPKPKIALIHATEKPNPKIKYMQDYVDILDIYRAGEFGKNVIIDGPLDIFLAVNKERGAIKNIPTPILGDADGLVFPNFESANTFYKTVIAFANAETGGTLTGTSKPVVLTSRGDSTESKYNSIAMAALLG